MSFFTHINISTII